MDQPGEWPRWTICAARELLRELMPVLAARGFVLTLCGSVLLDGCGRDLDIIAVPTSSACDALALLDELERLPGWTVLSANTRTAGFLSQVFGDPAGRLVDFTALSARPAGQAARTSASRGA